jgi:hypothetical protein
MEVVPQNPNKLQKREGTLHQVFEILNVRTSGIDKVLFQLFCTRLSFKRRWRVDHKTVLKNWPRVPSINFLTTSGKM